MNKYVTKLTSLAPLLFCIAQSAQAVIVVPENETFNIDYYESDLIRSYPGSTVNVLTGGSIEFGLDGNVGNLNILGGEVRETVSWITDTNMSSGYLAGVHANASGNCNLTISGGTVGSGGLGSTCNTTVTGGVIEGSVRTYWDGEAFLYGGVFESALLSTGGGRYHIYGGDYQAQEVTSTFEYVIVDFYGHGLSMTTPVLTRDRLYNPWYSTQVTGYLSDGNYIDMTVNNIAYDGVILHNTVVPVPSAVWLFGSGLLGLIGFAKRKAS